MLEAARTTLEAAISPFDYLDSDRKPQAGTKNEQLDERVSRPVSPKTGQRCFKQRLRGSDTPEVRFRQGKVLADV